jgi:hypothetical protein
MGAVMNEHGHPDTLVAAHPGNANALKSGVFSEAARGQRVQELEAAIAERETTEVLIDVLRREIAALAALGEAMDTALAKDGIRGRNGEPRNLVTLRFRLNDRLRHSLDAYAEAMRAPARSPEDTGDSDSDGDLPATLAGTIAAFHLRDSIDEISPRELDPEAYLRAVIATTDQRVTTRVRLDARKMLTRRSKQRSETCTCFATLRARDEIEFREWIDELRELPGFEPSPDDPALAAFVRAMARGDRNELPMVSRETEHAFTTVVSRGVARVLEPGKAEDPRHKTRESDSAIRPFWKTVLSPKDTLSAKERLQALAALEELDVLPSCRCQRKKKGPVLSEDRLDRLYAYAIRIVAEKHYRAALTIASFPETYVAVRDSIDAAIAETRGSTGESAVRAEARRAS